MQLQGPAGHRSPVSLVFHELPNRSQRALYPACTGPAAPQRPRLGSLTPFPSSHSLLSPRQPGAPSNRNPRIQNGAAATENTMALPQKCKQNYHMKTIALLSRGFSEPLYQKQHSFFFLVFFFFDPSTYTPLYHFVCIFVYLFIISPTGVLAQ